MRIAPFLTLLALLAGCADMNWNRSIYEGIRQRQNAAAAAGEVTPRPALPDYDQYRRERDRLRGNSSERPQ